MNESNLNNSSPYINRLFKKCKTETDFDLAGVVAVVSRFGAVQLFESGAAAGVGRRQFGDALAAEADADADADAVGVGRVRRRRRLHLRFHLGFRFVALFVNS